MKKEDDSIQSSCQAICLISPSFVFGDSVIVQYVMIGNFALQ